MPRKRLYKESMLTEGYKLGALGMTLEEIADFWNIGRNTLWRYCKKEPDLQMQIDKGKTEADMTVIQSLLQQCKEGNVTAAIFWLKNRRQNEWSDKKTFDHKGLKANVNIHETIIFSDIDDDLDQTEVYADQSAEGNRLN